VDAPTKEEHAHGAHAVLPDETDEFVEMYERVLKRALEECIEAITEEPLTKGPVKPRPLISPKQLRELAQIIRDAHTAVTIGGISPAVVPQEEVRRLIARGIVPKSALQIIDDAFMFGQLLSELRTLEQARVAKRFTYKQFKQRIKKKPIATTPHERAAMNTARQSAASYVTGLGNRVADDFSTIAIEADRKLQRKYREVIRDALQENIERRETVRQLASEIGHRTGDWARDLRRIAVTEKQRAMQEGQRERLVARHGDPKAIRVAKIPDPDACKRCIELHLTGGAGSKPRIFKLSDLEANGTNVGRKQAEWKAVVGPVHPWCACELVHVPEGWGFDDQGEMVPDRLRRAETLVHDLRKALSYGDSVPLKGVSVRVNDPEMAKIIEDVVARTPQALFTKQTGITLITTDVPGANSHLDDHDLAYWTGNEIRVMQTIPLDKVRTVVEHEIGHALNVHLMHSLGGSKPVREWHDKLDAISRAEGYVSEYAKKLPIENAAEVTKLYIYANEELRKKYPRQYAFVHRSYKDLFTDAATIEAFGLNEESQIDQLSADQMWKRFDVAATRHGMESYELPNGARIYALGSGPTLAILGGLHGDERAGPIALLRWLETTEKGALIPKGTALWMCPLFIGNAWDAFERKAGGIDFNRVWMPGQPGRDESVKIVERSLKRAKPRVFIDLHEDPDAPKPYVFGYQNDLAFAPKLAHGLGARWKSWTGKDEASIGASETFARFAGCRMTSTIETPRVKPIAERVDFHLRAVRWCSDYMAGEG
jgi:hypothetical protein